MFIQANPYQQMQFYGMQASMQVGMGHMPMQAGMGGMSMMAMGQISAPLAMGWAGYTGGLNGMAGMYGQMGMQGAMMMGGMSMPGPQSMGMVGMAGMGRMGMIDNTIEVAGSGMGKAKKYKMFPGELLAAHAVIKGGSKKPEAMAKELKERFGIDAEIKKVDGRQALVNKSTGNVIMTDGNGNNIMDSGDMKFKDALKTIEEKYGMTAKQFEQMYDRTKGGTGQTTGMNVPMAGGVMGMQNMDGMQGMYPFGGPFMGRGMSGMGMAGGIWGDPMWQNSIYGIFGSAYKYAGMYGGGMF
ncbi:MAG: hypothetical protein ACLFQV_08245 [Vulcanimicrobiota bacterium]